MWQQRSLATVGSLLGALMPSSCPVCRLRTVNARPCDGCVREFVPPRNFRIPSQLTACSAPFAYAYGVESVVLAVKRTNQHGLTRWMARCIAEVVSGLPDQAVVTWAPTSVQRRHDRGYDHGELLARAVARTLRLPVAGLLYRSSSPSSGESRSGREAVSFSLAPGARKLLLTQSPSVFIVDDVRTTGATLTAAASTLRAAGARTICGATFAAAGW